jgi:hypothetical protein
MGPGGSNGAPAWVLSGAVIDMSFSTNQYFGCSVASCLIVTRASTGYCSDNTGLFISFASNIARICSGTGLLVEEARTNLALWARDLTQSGTWVAVTMTAALNAIGADGSPNSATTLTSTSAAGTILQSLTAASTAYTYTVYVKGVTVTGAIQVADYPVLTPAFTTLTSANCFNAAGVGTAPASGQSSFLRCTVTATSLNPVIGFKFANSGDSIIVDFNQLEAAGFGTSPILTTSATQARAADQMQTTGLLDTIFNSSVGTVVLASGAAQNITNAYLVNANNEGGVFIIGISTATVANSAVVGHVITSALGSGSYTTTLVKTGASWDGTGRSLVANNGTVTTDANTYAFTTPNYIGSRNGVAGSQYDGYIPRLTMWSSRIPDAQLKSDTQ